LKGFAYKVHLSCWSVTKAEELQCLSKNVITHVLKTKEKRQNNNAYQAMAVKQE